MYRISDGVPKRLRADGRENISLKSRCGPMMLRIGENKKHA